MKRRQHALMMVEIEGNTMQEKGVPPLLPRVEPFLHGWGGKLVAWVAADPELAPNQNERMCAMLRSPAVRQKEGRAAAGSSEVSCHIAIH